MNKEMTNEIRTLINFIREFHPLLAGYDLENFTYHELTSMVKEIVKEF